MVTRKKADCSILLTRITRLKIVNSEIKSEGRNSYLERYSPKGSCHLDKSSMSHTLAQNCHCEFCCGNASYAQKQSLTGVGQWKDLKNSDSCHRHSQCRLEWTGSWPFPFNENTSLPNWQIVKTAHVQSEIKSKSKCFGLVWKSCLKIDMPVLGLAGCHWRENWNGFAGTSPGVPGDILGSYGELRWMEPHMSSPSPCIDKW